MWSVASEPLAPSAKPGTQGDKASTERQRPPPRPNQPSTGCPAATTWPPRSCCASLNPCLLCLTVKLTAQPTKGYLQGSNKDNLLTSILAPPCALIHLMHTRVHICMHTSTHTQTKHLRLSPTVPFAQAAGRREALADGVQPAVLADNSP